ncbi:hypothetical protein CHARACLAT_004286 [Characodon lateralis]|uniref:Uncharacterized protein n=1 Tax=Characodon lateralis TaxID=208331 RepID=A0ABU7F0D9_9TELE|nr:hypothetical protein [Characodon lateralis]
MSNKVLSYLQTSSFRSSSPHIGPTQTHIMTDGTSQQDQAGGMLPACYPELSVQLSQVSLRFALGGVPAGKQDLAVTFPFSIHCQDFHFTPNSFFQLWNNANRSQIMELSSAVHIYHCFIK